MCAGIVFQMGRKASFIRHGFFHRQVVAPIVALLTQGISPEKIALSVAFGIVLGIFPVLGATTVLCAVAALIFRLNPPAIQVVNYVIYPVQLFLLVPFIRIGEKLFRVAPLQLSLTQILAMVRADLPHAISTLWLAEMHAMAVWLLIASPAVLLIYFLLSWALRQVSAVSGSHSNTSNTAEAT